MELKENEKAYIAGIIDGEGCITASKVKSRKSTTIHQRVRVANSDGRLTEWLHKKCGGFIANYRRSGKPKWKSLKVWELSGRKGADLMRLILPYLVTKKEQAKLMIELSLLQLKSRKGKKYNEERQNKILEEYHQLNKRGI